MAIDPMQPGSTGPIPDARLYQSGGGQAARQPEGVPPEAAPGSPVPGDGGDEVRLSAEARGQDGGPAGVSASGLAPARLREILERLLSGYYDTTRVQDQVARRVANDPDL